MCINEGSMGSDSIDLMVSCFAVESDPIDSPSYESLHIAGFFM